MRDAIRQSRVPLLFGLLLLALDGFTKYLANMLLMPRHPVQTALPFWKWFLTYNEGYHYIFGELEYFGLTQALGLVAVSVLIVMMIRERRKMEWNDPMRKLFGGFIALLIGALGNPIETVTLGRVTDFFVFSPLPWPSNLADQYINLAIYVGLPIWLYLSFREWFAERRKQQSEGDEEQDLSSD